MARHTTADRPVRPGDSRTPAAPSRRLPHPDVCVATIVGMPSSALGRVKSTVLPAGKRRRTLPFGIARGISLQIDFEAQTKMFLGLYEVELNRHLRRLCRPGFDSFDVGAQFGYDALVMAKLSGARVLSFECDEGAMGELRDNIGSNTRYAPQIEVLQGFVSSTTDRAAGTVSLDDLIESGEAFVPKFVKMDIEGAEFDALQGARRLLERHGPNLLVETHAADIERDCLALVASLGYRTTVVDTRNWLPDYRPTAHNRWFVATHPRLTPGGP